MEEGSSGGGGIPNSTLDLAFGFNDANYCDRTLLLQILDNHDNFLPNVKRCRKSAPVKTIPVSSLILAGRSPYFRKLFSNGMLETAKKKVEVCIQASEENSFMDLLKYMYSTNLPTAIDALIDLLVIADKFEVASCMRDCTQSLQNSPMTTELASLYLDLHQSILTIQPLADAAKLFLIANFKDFKKSNEEMLKLSLPCIQSILSSDELQVPSEMYVYSFVLKWAHKHYPQLKERREILKMHLLSVIRFPFMTTKELLGKVLSCINIDRELASKIVISALSFKASTVDEHRCLIVGEGILTSSQFVERSYLNPRVKLVEFVKPDPHCIVFLDLRRDELKCINSDRVVLSRIFQLGVQKFKFYVHILDGRLMVVLRMMGYGTVEEYSVKYEIQLKKMPQKEFVSLINGDHIFCGMGFMKILDISQWISDDSDYFINDLIYMRANFRMEE